MFERRIPDTNYFNVIESTKGMGRAIYTDEWIYQLYIYYDKENDRYVIVHKGKVIDKCTGEWYTKVFCKPVTINVTNLINSYKHDCFNDAYWWKMLRDDCVERLSVLWGYNLTELQKVYFYNNFEEPINRIKEHYRMRCEREK